MQGVLPAVPLQSEDAISTLPILPDLPDDLIETPLPVLNYSTGAGWHSWGQARSARAAKRIVEANLPSNARSLLGYGFKLTIARRSDLHKELNGGPDGFVWSVGK